MGSIERFAKRVAKKDTAVYWGPTTSMNADGTPVFSTPVQINCVWINTSETVVSDTGEEFVSRATIVVIQDLVQEGILWHGALADLSTGEKADHRTVIGAYPIKVFRKTPSLNFGHSRKVIL